MNVVFHRIVACLISFLILIACDSTEKTETKELADTMATPAVVKQAPAVSPEVPDTTRPAVKMTKTEEVEAQIKRIETKLKTEPKVEGWVLVGDAYMHLMRYDDAVRSYKEAYLLSGQSKETRNKLKRALRYADPYE